MGAGAGRGAVGGGMPANTTRPLDHHLGNPTGPVARTFYGWSFRKIHEPGDTASWSRCRKTALPYSSDELSRIVQRSAGVVGGGGKRSGRTGGVSEQYNALRSAHQRSQVDGLLEWVRGEERNPNAEWSLACIEQDVQEFIKRGFGKVRETREMRVILRRSPRKGGMSGGPGGKADGYPGEVVDLEHGHVGTQPLHGMLGGAGAPGAFGMTGGMHGGGPGAGPPGGSGLGRGAPMNPQHGHPGGGPHGMGGGPQGMGGGPQGMGGGPQGMGGGPPPPPMHGMPPPPPPPPMHGGVQPPHRGPGADGMGGLGIAEFGNMKPGKPVKEGKKGRQPEIIFDDDELDNFEDNFRDPVDMAFGKPPKPGKVKIPPPPINVGGGQPGKPPKQGKGSSEPEIRRVPSNHNFININVQDAVKDKQKKPHKHHGRGYHDRYSSSSDEDRSFTPPYVSSEDEWSISTPPSSFGGSPPRYRERLRSRSRNRHQYPVRTHHREHEKPRPILRGRDYGYKLSPAVDEDGYYRNGGYDVEPRDYEYRDVERQYLALRPAYSPPRRRLYEHSRERGWGDRPMLPAPAPEVDDMPWRRGGGGISRRREELDRRERSMYAEMDLFAREEELRNLASTMGAIRGRRTGRRAY